MNNVVGLKEYRLARAYYTFGNNINLALDTVPREKAKRDYKREMTKGYLSLLSNKQN
jgi:hypothetical protein